MKQRFKELNLREETMTLIAECNLVITDYQAQGFRLTLRQLYYQLVQANIIANTEKVYRKLSATVSDGRLAGLIDWDAIEDRIRQPVTNNEWGSVEQIVAAAISQFRLARWDNQDNYVELWVEKDALAGVLAPLGRRYHVTIMVNRGYSSQSAMKESAERFRDAIQQGKTCHLLYLGDHDPSGEDMVRDIGDRLEMFGVVVYVNKIGLTMDQVRQYDPPPNPAKIADPRAAGYIAKYGDSSWEVDALNPATLQALITKHIEDLRDEEAWNEKLAEEEEQRVHVRKKLGLKAV